MIFNDLQKYNENNNKYLLTLMQIKIVFWFSIGKKRDWVVGNGVVVLGGKQLIRIPKLRRLRWYVNDQIYANSTARGRVLIQIRT